MKHAYFKSSKKKFKDSIVNQNENHEAAGLRHLAFEVDDLSVAIDELDNKVMQQVSIQYYSSPCGEIILASVGDFQRRIRNILQKRGWLPSVNMRRIS